MEGDHQHCFRKKISTITAQLELQDQVASNHDSNILTATCSIDMSAAFDLLPPRIFHQLNLAQNATNTIMDFMSGHLFKVEVSKNFSQPGSLNVGCSQGPVLGTKLFGLYNKDIKDKVGDHTSSHKQMIPTSH